MSKLKPCPFCGNEARISSGCYGYTGGDYVRVGCPVHRSVHVDGRYNSWNTSEGTREQAEQFAIRAWNTRHTPLEGEMLAMLKRLAKDGCLKTAVPCQRSEHPCTNCRELAALIAKVEGRD